MLIIMSFLTRECVAINGVIAFREKRTRSVGRWAVNFNRAISLNALFVALLSFMSWN